MEESSLSNNKKKNGSIVKRQAYQMQQHITFEQLMFPKRLRLVKDLLHKKKTIR